MHPRVKFILDGIQNRLNSVSIDLENDLVKIITGELTNLKEGKTFDDVVRIHFEYDYDDLNIYFWQEDYDQNVLNDRVLAIPINKTDDLFPNELSDIDLEDELFDQGYSEEEIYSNILSNYDEDRCEILEQWFHHCWKNAREKVELTRQAFFSIHDTNSKTKLN